MEGLRRMEQQRSHWLILLTLALIEVRRRGLRREPWLGGDRKRGALLREKERIGGCWARLTQGVESSSIGHHDR